MTQLYVVDVEDRKSGKVSAIYVFDNHDAALQCRRELKMNSDHLRGVVVFSGWNDGQPHRAQRS